MVVADSCILIYLSRIGSLPLLRDLGKVIVTSEVYREVVVEPGGRAGSEQLEEAFGKWIRTCEIRSTELRKIVRLGGVDEADASLLLLARERDETLITNDKNLIQLARSMNVECWWPTTLLLKLAKSGKITGKEAEDILFELVSSGLRMEAGVYAAVVLQLRKMK